MNKRLIFGLVFLHLLLHPGFLIDIQAQDTTNTIGRVTIASPTAASLGKFGDIPVSYHTGIPDISIPIYTVKSGSLQLPVGLSYHAGGLKVQENAGWVGAGWALNAGGVITRTVVGAPDDRGFSTSNVLFGHYTDYGYTHYYAQQDIAQVDLNMTRGFADGEPDLYFFNFGGYTGKFYFNDDRTPMLIPQQDFKIQPFLASGQGFTGWIITVPDGTRYFFGAQGNNNPAVNPIEITNPCTVQNGPSNTTAAASSWFLNKILSADGVDSITLNYVQENYSYYAVSTAPVLDYQYLHFSNEYNVEYGMNLTKNLVQGVRLTQIAFANGMMTFNPVASPRQDLSNSSGVFVTNTMNDNANTSSYALGSITISDNTGFCKKDSLYTSYFQDLGTSLPGSSGDFWSNYSSFNLHTDAYRLRLDSIQETTCDATLKVPPYRFTYFGENVPRRLSFGMDHWGYPNSSDGNRTLIPSLTIITNGTPSVIGGGNRDAAWPAMRGGTLQQITYPTRGSTVFDYEPKNIYTFSNSVLEDVSLQHPAIGQPGNPTISQTLPFTLSSAGFNCTISVSITVGNAEPDLRITNSAGQEVLFTGYISGTSYTNTLTLPPGNYTATLEYMNLGSTLPTGKANATIGQMQYVTHTTTLTVGGLRIKTITNKDGLTAKDVVTSYNYTGGGAQTTGVLYSIPVYAQVIRSDVYQRVWGPTTPGNPNGCASLDGFNAHTAYYSAGSIRPMASVQGENFGYNEVDVSQTGNGHSVYRYYGSNLWSQNVTDVCVRTLTQSNLCSTSIPNYPAPPLPFEFMRDELSYEGYFNESGQVLKETYHFPVYSADPIVTPGHSGINIPSFVTFTEYTLQTARKIKDSTVTTLYDRTGGGGQITTVGATYYGSPFHHKPTRTIGYTSKGEVLATNTKYALDFRIGSCDAIPDSLTYYQTAIGNDLTWMYANIDSCTPQTNDASNCRLYTYAQFRLMLAQDRRNFVRYRRNAYAADSANQQNSCYLAAQGSADNYLNPILRLQQGYNNAPIEVSQFKNGNVRSASFTKYDNSVFPTGFAYPGRTQLVSLQAPSSTFTNAVVSGNTIARDNRYLDEATYSFNAGHPQQVTGHDGIAMSYLWDYSNKEPIAKVVNATVDQVAYTSFEADGNGSWAIPAGGRDNANAITGSSSYNLSNGAVSRSGLTVTATYVVSYWSKTGASYSVVGSTSVQQGKTIAFPTGGTWAYFEHTVAGVSTITVSGTGDIDELRLYPAAAQMTYYTYRPLMGMTSQCDVDNRVSYYEYDGLGRLRDIKDQDGNIIKTVQYHYAYGQQSNGY